MEKTKQNKYKKEKTKVCFHRGSREIRKVVSDAGKIQVVEYLYWLEEIWNTQKTKAINKHFTKLSREMENCRKITEVPETSVMPLSRDGWSARIEYNILDKRNVNDIVGLILTGVWGTIYIRGKGIL